MNFVHAQHDLAWDLETQTSTISPFPDSFRGQSEWERLPQIECQSRESRTWQTDSFLLKKRAWEFLFSVLCARLFFSVYCARLLRVSIFSPRVEMGKDATTAHSVIWSLGFLGSTHARCRSEGACFAIRSYSLGIRAKYKSSSLKKRKCKKKEFHEIHNTRESTQYISHPKCVSFVLCTP